ncbi:hypothetical protein Q8A67_023432 [Cirrhinus molitorella]|uniref:Galactosylgalactosylxylosylprotein 3-beta-glucuronosyltransferase n=1 Tax=Cirrhinus molitorella TaxID=172907 RepID=A0AA88TA62_9TELE|nr:hypothetical protein Q8A67_023432 [Cirrhinus molitorella]
MAGFALNLHLILSKPQAYFKLKGVKGGYQECSLLQDLVTLSDLEPKAANCTKKVIRDLKGSARPPQKKIMRKSFSIANWQANPTKTLV